MSELKPCPFCGDMPASMKAELDGKKRYGCKNCTPNLWYTPERWNTRPIEDALNARVAELEAENAALKAEPKPLAYWSDEKKQPYADNEGRSAKGARNE